MRGCFTRAWCCATLCVVAVAVAVFGTDAPLANADANADANVDRDAATVANVAETVPARLSDRQIAVHVLNRMAFGPQPGEVAALIAIGWEPWVNAQLDPQSIDDGELDATLKERFPSLYMSMGQIFQTYRPSPTGDQPTREERRERARLAQKARKELATSVLMRALQSERQFLEVIVEFWRNHFNVYTADQNKQDIAVLANHYEQQVIRKHAFGKFGDMLMASAKHPAMLIYLDNAVSQKSLTDKEEQMAARVARSRRQLRSILSQVRQRGLNENYARELMELHTIGVEQENRRGGYSQQDVIELSRALTGWTAAFSEDKTDYGFRFKADVHDRLPKTVLGRRLKGRPGLKEGEAIIKRLALDPRTANFISRKLCRYLVDDDPPKALVKRVAGVFRRTRGNLPKVYDAIVTSAEFLDPDHYQSKFKTPFEFTVSALRATGATVQDHDELLEALGHMGQPIYGKEDPTGYYDQAEAWLDPGVLLHRWQFTLHLAEGRLDGVAMDEEFVMSLVKLPPDQMKQRMVQQLLPAGVDEQTRQILDHAIDSFGMYRRQVLGLLLGSPAFQQQ